MKKDTVVLTVEMPRKMLERMRALAKKRKISTAELARQAIEWKLKLDEWFPDDPSKYEERGYK
jgi:predicted transcriptional regulator